MKNSFFSIFLMLFLAAGAGIAAQGRDFFPYVTQIQVESRSSLVRLTWTDSPDARGPVYIFRSTRPFGGVIPAHIRPVVVRYGEQSYIDDIDDIENLFYFIAASDTSGQRYDIFLPRINSTSLVVAQTQEELQVLAPGVSAAPIEGVFNLRARLDGERVVISFESTFPRRNLILYRSTQPVRQPQDLLNAVIVQSGIASPFVDFPVPGLNWFYTVIYEDEITSGNMGIRPGINTTVSALTIIDADAAERSMRPIPLPILTLRSAANEEFFLTETFERGSLETQASLNQNSVNILRNTRIPQKGPINLKVPRVFLTDLSAPTSGEESALFQIVSEQFIKLEWDAALVSLRHYLFLPRSSEVEARARFYLGQSLYYTGNFREALMEFLSFRIHNLAEANVWIDAVLAAMVY